MHTDLQTFKAEFFRALAHPIRIRILECLGRQEHSVQQLQRRLEISQPVVSQQLAILRGKGIVAARKVGNTVRYELRDPRIMELLETARAIFNSHLVGTRDMLKQLRREAR